MCDSDSQSLSVNRSAFLGGEFPPSLHVFRPEWATQGASSKVEGDVPNILFNSKTSGL